MSATSDPRSEVRLTALAQLGDREAFDLLLRATEGWLYGYLRKLTRDPELALDVLQDVYLIVYRRLSSLHEPRLFRPWVYRIATRRALRLLDRRRRHRRELTLGELEVAAPIPEELDPDLQRALHDGVAELPPATRTVFLLHYFEGLTLRESAEVLDIPAGTVKSRLAYGLELLRDRFRKESEIENT